MQVVFFNSAVYGGAAQAAIRIFETISPYRNASFVTSVGNTEHFPFMEKPTNATLKTTLYHLVEQTYFATIGTASDRILTLNKWGIDVLPFAKKADIIHLHWINRAFISLKMLEKIAKLNKPIVWTMHDMAGFTGLCSYADGCENFKESCGNCMYLKYKSANDLSNINFEKKKAVYKKLDLHIVTCSQWLANTAKESTLLKDFPIVHIPNPIDTQRFRKLDNRDLLREESGIPKNNKVIAFGAAKLGVPRKGFTYFVAAMQILHQRKLENITVLLVGNDKNVSVKDIPFPIIHLKNVSTDRMVEAYNLADIYTLPSLQDNFPNMVLEAMACSIPVVGFEAGGIPEMINHKENGYVAKVKDSDDLATGIEWCLHNDLSNLSTEARKKVEANYSYEIVGEKYLELYQSLY